MKNKFLIYNLIINLFIVIIFVIMIVIIGMKIGKSQCEKIAKLTNNNLIYTNDGECLEVKK